MKNKCTFLSKKISAILLFILIITIVLLYFLIHKFYTHEKWQSSQIAELSKQMNTLKSDNSVELPRVIQDGDSQSFYQKLQAGLPVNIIIIGDSIGSGAGSSDASHTWMSLLADYLKETYNSDITLTNISMGGNASYAGYVRALSLDNNIEYDLVIFCYGQNDSPDDFGLYYESMIRAVKKRWSNCSMISILESSQRSYTEKMETIKTLADYYGILVADTIKPFTDGSNGEYDDLTRDTVHPNDEGQAVYAEVIEKIIDNEVKLSPINLEADSFENFIWFGKDSFEREGNVFTLKTDPENPISGIMGIDYTFVSGENTCTITIDDILYSAPEIAFNYDFSQRHIMIVNPDINTPVTVNNKVEISFQTEQQADGFYGICFSGGSENDS